jgi:nicotinate-nucleotide pyrophosphorylase (carboxylating)
MIAFDHDETLAQARERNIRDALMEDIGRRDWSWCRPNSG